MDERLTCYLDHMRVQRRRSEHTIRMYRSILGSFFRDVVGERKLDDVQLEELEKWTHRPRTGGRAGNAVITPSDATVARDVAVVRSLFTWALPRRHATLNTSLDLHGPHVNNEQPRPMPDRDWAQWWAAPLPMEARAVLALGYVGGLRREEITGLRTHNVRLDPPVLVGFPRKGRGRVLGNVPIFVGMETLQVDCGPELRYVHDRSDGSLVVPWLEMYGAAGTARTQKLTRWMERLGREHSLPRFTMHQLRHACATNLLREGMPIQLVREYMNHTNIQTTLRYARTDEDAMVEWLNRNQ